MVIQKIVYLPDGVEINVSLHELFAKVSLRNNSKSQLQIYKLEITPKENVQFPDGINPSMKHAIYNKVRTSLFKIRQKRTWSDTEDLVTLIKKASIDNMEVTIPLL